jgi:TetR/AcrR family transcriptional repressor of nem operon
MIRVGLEAMYKKGFNATGVQEVVDGAGVPKGSFYNYFRSKERFAVEIIDQYTGEVLERLDAFLGNGAVPPLERILSLYRTLITEYVKEGAFCHGCFAGNLCQEMGDTSEAIRKEAERAFLRMARPVERCITEAQEAGELSAEYSAQSLALFIQNSWHGALMRMKASKSERPLEIFHELLGRLLRG